jgi:hypothetical protein
MQGIGQIQGTKSKSLAKARILFLSAGSALHQLRSKPMVSW